MGFKVGDRVRCKPGFTNSGHENDSKYGGGGYVEGKEFIIDNTNSACAFPDSIKMGVYFRALELVQVKDLFITIL